MFCKLKLFDFGLPLWNVGYHSGIASTIPLGEYSWVAPVLCLLCIIESSTECAIYLEYKFPILHLNVRFIWVYDACCSIWILFYDPQTFNKYMDSGGLLITR
jgi:hypothetical protein